MAVDIYFPGAVMLRYLKPMKDAAVAILVLVSFASLRGGFNFQRSVHAYTLGTAFRLLIRFGTSLLDVDV